jgi:hypothetical protein
MITTLTGILEPLTDKLGRIALRDLTAEDVRKVLASNTETRASRTVRDTRAALVRVIKFAQARGLIARKWRREQAVLEHVDLRELVSVMTDQIHSEPRVRSARTAAGLADDGYYAACPEHGDAFANWADRPRKWALRDA